MTSVTSTPGPTGLTLSVANSTTAPVLEVEGNLNWANLLKVGGDLAHLPTRNFASLQNKPTTLAGYGITDVLAGLTVGQKLFVDATTGNDTTAADNLYRQDKPFATITEANNNASPGDTVIVGPGVYNERSICKNGINLHLEEGTTIQCTDTADGALIDDSLYGTAGPLVCRISGKGRFIRNAGAGEHPRCPAILLTNAGSDVIIEADIIEARGFGGGTDFTAPYAIRHVAGKLNVTARRIHGDLAAIWWDNGEAYIRATEITASTANSSAIYCSADSPGLDDFSTPYTGGYFWVDAQRIGHTNDSLQSRVSVLNNAPAARVWITAKEIAGITNLNGGKNYLTVQKVRGLILGAGENWVNAQKVQATEGLYSVQLHSGVNYVNVQQVVHGGTSTMVRVLSGTNFLAGQSWKTALDRTSMTVSNGTTYLTGVVLDNPGATTRDTLVVSGGSLTLIGSVLRTPIGRSSLVQSGASVITILGSKYDGNVSGTITEGNALLAASFRRRTYNPPALSGTLTFNYSGEYLSITHVTLNGNVTSVPSPGGSPVDGHRIEMHIAQDGTGGRTVTGFNAIFNRGVTPTTWNTTPGGTIKVLYEYDSTLVKWCELAVVGPF